MFYILYISTYNNRNASEKLTALLVLGFMFPLSTRTLLMKIGTVPSHYLAAQLLLAIDYFQRCQFLFGKGLLSFVQHNNNMVYYTTNDSILIATQLQVSSSGNFSWWIFAEINYLLLMISTN